MNTYIKTFYTALCCFSLYACSLSFAETSEKTPKAQVMMLGVFHFANPGRDSVKHDSFAIHSKESQEYLEQLSKNIQAFQPTKVLVEHAPEKQSIIQKEYRDYLNGQFKLGTSETYQVGFRVAKAAGLQTLYGYDEHNIGWESSALFEYMNTEDGKMKAEVDKLINEVQDETNAQFKSLSLKQMLIKYNGKPADDLNKYFYIQTNPAFHKGEYIGAKAAASWWHRNFIMYAKIQAHATPGERVLVIGGQGHTAILKDFLAIDRDRIAVDIKDYL